MRIVALLLSAVSCAACFQMATVMKVNGDGSGTVEHRMLFTTQALRQLKQFGALGGGRGGRTIDPTSEEQAREMAAALGPGVTYVSSTPVNAPTGEGRDAVYAFTDVNQVRLAAGPAAPAGVAIRAQDWGSDAEALTFSLTREEGNPANVVLHIHVPEPAIIETLASNTSTVPQQLPMIKALLAGARIALSVEPGGTLVRTSSPHVDGQRVTLLEVDLDNVFKDVDTLVPKLQAATTPDEVKAVLKDVPGLKISLEREITIVFTPR